MSQRKSIEELRDHRSNVLREKQRAELRNLHGSRLIDALNLAAHDAISLAEFHVDVAPPFILDWPARLEEASGLVLAYASKNKATGVALCIDEKLGRVNGLIGFHDKDYLGFCHVSQLKLGGLVAAAEAANDAVTFYPASLNGVIVVDCYAGNHGMPFSILVQGEILIERLRECFSDNDPL